MAAFPDGSLIKGSGPAIYVMKVGQRCLIPNPQTFDIDGYSWAAVLQIPDAQLSAIPVGPDVPAYTTFIYPGPGDQSVLRDGVPYGSWHSGGGGHYVYGRAEMNLQTGKVNGTLITLNNVEFAGYHSGTSVLCYDINEIAINAGDAARVVRGYADAKGISADPNVKILPWEIDIPVDVASRTRKFTLQITDNPDGLKQIMDKSLGSVISQVTPLVVAIGAVFGGKATSSPPKAN
jgi:hypothetical protein